MPVLIFTSYMYYTIISRGKRSEYRIRNDKSALGISIDISKCEFILNNT
jgi:hypothetical protein